MHIRARLVALTAIATIAAGACGGTGDTSTTTGIEVDDVRSRVSLASTGFGAVYMDLTNPGDVDDELVSASVDDEVAGTVELHETVPMEDGSATDDMSDDETDGSAMDDMSEGEASSGMDGMSEGEGGMTGMAGMEMRQVEGIAVPAGETVTLEPGGLHVMLIDLATDLEEGDQFDVTLEFEQAGAVTVTSTVSANP